MNLSQIIFNIYLIIADSRMHYHHYFMLLLHLLNIMMVVLIVSSPMTCPITLVSYPNHYMFINLMVLLSKLMDMVSSSSNVLLHMSSFHYGLHITYLQIHNAHLVLQLWNTNYILTLLLNILTHYPSLLLQVIIWFFHLFVVYLISPGCDPVMGDNRAKQWFVYLLFL